MSRTQEADAPPVDILAPAEQLVPFVFASPHSGADYYPSFLAQSALDATALRRSEDIYVDRLFAQAVRRGAPLLKAVFPRAYLDPNREPYELDQAMFGERLPAHVNTRSPRVVAGLGTIARVVASGADIYAGSLTFADAENRIDRLYRPYHRALSDLIEATRRRFGVCVLIDCHSMPSIGGPMDADPGLARLDFVLGDCYGASCAPVVVEAADATLSAQGYRVLRNNPYAGGFTTRHYGRPANGVHALQIEINRRLYVDELTYRPLPAFAALERDLGALIDALVALPPAELAHR